MGTPRRTIGIVMNGVSGRMGYRQHLLRSILAIREQGGLPLADGTMLWPEPVLVGRSEAKLRAIAERHGLTDWSADLAEALARPDVEVYFDAQITGARAGAIRAAIAAGKHVYTEKPLASGLDGALDLARLADEAGIKHGVVQDKLFLPGLRKLKRLVDGGFFGRILSVRGEFGYWVFEGDWQDAQRPSWNYRAEDGGGLIADMFCHWRYVLDEIIAPVRSVQCLGTTHIPEHRRPFANSQVDMEVADLAVSHSPMPRPMLRARVSRQHTTQVPPPTRFAPNTRPAALP